MRILEIQKEYERILGIFKDIDENQLALLDGAIWECARLRIELNNLHKLMGETGAVSYNPSNPKMQKELPISKVIVKSIYRFRLSRQELFMEKYDTYSQENSI